MKWQSIQKPKQIFHDKTVSKPSYGRFFIEPLEKGFGNTIGNALRRIILSSMQGAAITSFRIEGVLHEFTTLPGIIEDLSEIVLNLKSVRIKVRRDFPVPLYIEVERDGLVTAGNIQGDHESIIVNPEQPILTLAKKQKLRIDLDVGSGKGFVVAAENKKENVPIGTIFIDSIFTPIEKVNYIVEPARVGQRTDYDKLTIDIWTDGTLRPEEAITMGARLLIEHLDLFIIPEAEVEQVHEEKIDENMLIVKNLLRMPVSELELSVRAANCLSAANIHIMADLVQKSEGEMLKYRNFGRKSLEELSKVLEDLNISFGMDVGKYFVKEELEEFREIAIHEEEEKKRKPRVSSKRAEEKALKEAQKEPEETEEELEAVEKVEEEFESVEEAEEPVEEPIEEYHFTEDLESIDSEQGEMVYEDQIPPPRKYTRKTSTTKTPKKKATTKKTTAKKTPAKKTAKKKTVTVEAPAEEKAEVVPEAQTEVKAEVVSEAQTVVIAEIVPETQTEETTENIKTDSEI